MAFPTTHFSNKGSFIIACFCFLFLLYSCSPLERMKGFEDERDEEPESDYELSCLLDENVSEFKGLLDEFHILEENVDRLNCDVDFNPSYISLAERIRDFEWDPRLLIQSAEYGEVLHYLHTAVMIREINMKYNYESNLIVNITDHLHSVKKDMETLRESFNGNTKLEVINKYKQQYKLSIQEKLRESNYLVENFIRPSLEMIEHDLNYKFDSLLGQKNKEIFSGREKMLEKALVRRELLTSFKLVVDMMSFLSGPGISAVWHIGGGSDGRESLCYLNRSINNYREITSEVNTLEEKIKSIIQHKIKHFIKVLDECYNVARLLPEKFGNVLQKLFEIKQKLSQKELGFKEVRILEDEFREKINISISEIEAKDSLQSNYNVNIKTIMKYVIIEKLKEFVSLGISIPNILQNFEDDPSNLMLKEYTYQNNLIIMKNYEDGIQDMIHKVVSNIESDISFKNLLQKTECSPALASWKVQRFLIETKKNLSEMTYLLAAEGEFLNFLEVFKETMTALVEVYDHLQNYLEQQYLAFSIKRICNFNDENGINNTQFPGAVDELELSIRSNIALQRYRTAIDAFKQFVFPFASLYLHDLIPLYPSDGGAIAEAVSQIEIVESRIKLYEQSVRNPDNYIAKKEFNGAINSSRPFYVWKNNDHRSAIRDLLCGKEVLLKADISGSPIGMDVIKFGIIGLEFKTSNRDLQSNFTKLLKNFRLKGVHLGNSYYRYDSKIYLMSTNSREFDFPFEMKRKTGDMMLSPYASWKFTLVSMTEEADFEELQKYVEETDLELVGSGFYVTWNKVHENLEYIDLNVEKYYTPVDEKGNNLC